jgi:prepilin-type N-terminal cleavage/methylation domain-containing protein
MITLSRLPTSDDGFTLIEVLIATVILGLGVAALVAGLGTHAKVSLANRNQSQAATTLTAASEYVKSLKWGTDFSSCPAGPSRLVSATDVPRAEGMTVTYGPATSLDTQTPCSVLAVVPVVVDGNGFHLSTSVIKRPTDAP